VGVCRPPRNAEGCHFEARAKLAEIASPDGDISTTVILICDLKRIKSRDGFFEWPMTTSISFLKVGHSPSSFKKWGI
jgi:hypothetical protein